MIYCNLKGGLANMLFQIAATKSFAIDKGVDCSFPNLQYQYQLLNNDNFYNPNLKHSYEYNYMFRNLNMHGPTHHLPLISYPFEYVNIETPIDNFAIDGFFQSELYFKHNLDEIREYLSLPEDIIEKINDKYSHIFKQKTTSIHIRRGDYSKFPNHHPILSLEYYLKAIDIVKDKTDIFLIFSDDIEWCKNNLKLENTIYFDSEKDYIDLYLMSICDNNIIANSSFSLWSSIMNKNIDKIVIGPNIWFGPEINFNTRDVLPKNYIKL